MITDWLWFTFLGFNAFVIVYFFLLNTSYLLASLAAFRELRTYARRLKSINVDELITAAGAPGVTVVAPAFNEERTCVDTVRSLLMLEYSDYEIILVNDGSRDRTFHCLADAFELVPTPRFPTADLATQPVHETYQSRTHPNLWVINKENGGRADALNVGINYCRTPLCCVVDADSILERDALMRVIRPFLEDATTVGAGGIIRVANGCRIEKGLVRSVHLPSSFLAKLQVVEYLRAFLSGRVGWNAANATYIISGGFGIWRRSTLVDAGGYDPETVGEDMELTIRVHRHCREQKIPYRITYVPDPVLWTEVPETFRDLGRQRDRWQRGLVELLLRHRRMLLNPRYGRIGMLAYPYLFLLEMFGPLIEFLGYFAISYAIIAGVVAPTWLIAMLVLALAFGIAVSIASIALEELVFRRYSRYSDVLFLFLFAVLENFGPRQLLTFWRVRGLVSFFWGKKGWGGSLERKGFGAPLQPTQSPSAVRT